jgi:hypothetical protein
MSNFTENLRVEAMNRNFRGWLVLLSIGSLVQFLAGCYPVDDASSRSFKLYQNRYYQSSVYPEYVKVLYLIKDLEYSSVKDNDLLLNALALLKKDYESAFRNGTLGEQKFALVTISESYDKAAILIKITDLFEFPLALILKRAQVEHDPKKFMGENEKCEMIQEHVKQRKIKAEKVIENLN